MLSFVMNELKYTNFHTARILNIYIGSNEIARGGKHVQFYTSEVPQNVNPSKLQCPCFCLNINNS